MRYIKGIQREETVLFPDSIDDYVEENNLVRFIDAFINTLDMKELGFRYSQPKETGRKAYNPSSMLKLYIYGYIQRIRSSRRLEAETKRNVELMWLIEKLAPDFKTIADFRKDNINSLKKVFREFTLLCKTMNLFGKELAVIDGSKFKAVNSKAKCFTKGFLKSELKEIDEKINKHLKEIEAIDREERNSSKIDKEKLQSHIKNIQEKKEEVRQMLEKIKSGEIDQISKTDKDSRMMKQAGGGYKVSYNGQISVDSKHHLIIAAEVTNEGNDLKQLSNMAKKSKEVFEEENEETNNNNANGNNTNGNNTNDKIEKTKYKVVADTGYHKGEEVAKCESEEIECYVPSPNRSPNKKAGRHGIEDFKYDKDKDLYVCPAGEELTFRFKYNRDDKEIRRYECNKCKECSLRDKCIKSKGNKIINRGPHEEALQIVRERCKANPDIIKKRGQIVEHIFGTIKEAIGFGGGFLLKGLEKVNGEFSLITLSYNIRRVQNILGIKNMIIMLNQA
jgi:transposase